MVDVATDSSRRRAMVANISAAALGLCFIAPAVGMDADWQSRHFLPAWMWPWQTQLRILLVLRLALGMAGLALIVLLRPWLTRAFARGRGRDALISLALVVAAAAAAVGATESVLRTRVWRGTSDRAEPEEPLRAREALLGWTLAPNHVGSARLGGRTVRYATDRWGYRLAAPGASVDLTRPSILFAGESIISGYGLQWTESLPGQVEARTGLQAADMAVTSYATDQTLLRLKREIVRFAQPVAVVVPFVPRLFDRDLDRDRPHLDSALRWHPAEPPPMRLVELGRRVVRYRSCASIDQGVKMTQAALRAMVNVAHSRGAVAIILVPQFLPESQQEREVRRDVLDSAALPYLLVPLRAGWRIPGDRHPDARGASAMAEAVAARLSNVLGRTG